MATLKSTTSAISKTLGTQRVAKTDDSFAVAASQISVSASGITATNVKDALTELSGKVPTSQATAPTGQAAQEGDLWYDTDDDQLYVRRNSTWTEIVQEDLTGDIDGGTW
tara:strand:+ start:250 stop:579 length:330 start_codon:yes stop_codon:yes gene_type:complete